MTTRKSKSNKQAIRNFMFSIIQAMKYEWTDQRQKTIDLDAKELLRRLEPDSNLTDEDIKDITTW